MDFSWPPEAEAFREKVHAILSEHLPAGWQGIGALAPDETIKFTEEWRKVLADKGVRILPDVLVNGGGVTGSYFEWTQNIQQFRWKEERFNDELRAKMVEAFEAVADYADGHGIGMRLAAFSLGLERVARAVRLRGYV